MSRRAFFGLGSNLGDRWTHLQHGADGLRAAGEVSGISRIYESAPIGGPEGQGPFLNCVVGVVTDLDPEALLGIARRLEDERGRVRVERWGARTLDVDVLTIDGWVSDDAHLSIPHPRMWERAFVLAPLEELDATLVPAGWRERLGGEGAITTALRPVGSMLHGGRVTFAGGAE